MLGAVLLTRWGLGSPWRVCWSRGCGPGPEFLCLQVRDGPEDAHFEMFPGRKAGLVRPRLGNPCWAGFCPS